MFGGKSGYLSDYVSQEFEWVDSEKGSEEMKKNAEEFVGTIGFGDYKCEDDEPEAGLYMEGVPNEVMAVRGIPEAYYKDDRCETVWIYRFSLEGEKDSEVGLFDVRFIECDESKNLMNTNSYIDVYVNDAGVLGCEMVNPLEVVKVEETSNIISPKDVKDIIYENISDKNAWNIPVDDVGKTLMLTKWRLINFPIRSKEYNNEYTYIPAYILYHEINSDDSFVSNTEQLRNEPFMLINALDGSIIKVQEELSDFPSGYTRGNEGYEALLNGRWKRDEGVSFESFYNMNYDELVNDMYYQFLHSATNASH